MPDFLQFPCPACGVPLRLPVEGSGKAGNCPVCGQGIIAPNAWSGTPARVLTRATPAPPPSRLAPAPPRGTPFIDSPPVAAPVSPHDEAPFAAPPRHTESRPLSESPPPSSAPLPTPAVSHPPCRFRGGMVFFPILLLVAMLAFLGGYLFGSRNSFDPPSPRVAIPPPATNAIPEKPAPKPEPVAPAPVLVKPKQIPLLTPEPEEKTPTHPAPESAPAKTASASAEAALRAFLDAPDWARRAAYVLDAPRVRPLMETYARSHGDAATAFDHISLQSGETDRETGSTLFLFSVKTAKQPDGFPVAVHESIDGWLVDWETFVEFEDDLFKAFTAGPPGQSARFHLLVTRPSAERAAATENEFFTPYLLDPPMPGRGQLGYVRKNTDAQARLESAIRRRKVATPVIEVAKRATNDGKTYLEVVKILADDWRPNDQR